MCVCVYICLILVLDFKSVFWVRLRERWESEFGVGWENETQIEEKKEEDCEYFQLFHLVIFKLYN